MQANVILEGAHQTTSNILHMFEINNSKMVLDNTWVTILSAVIFTMQPTVHTTTQATTMQLVFSLDPMLNLTFDSNWQLIKARKQTLINKNGMQENKNREKHASSTSLL